MFYDNFIQLCAKKDVSPSGAAKAIGLSNAAASGWKAGKQPSEITLNKLAIFFDVPVSALTDEKEPAAQTGDGSLDEELAEALTLFRQLWPENKKQVIDFSQALLRIQESSGDHPSTSS